MIVLVVLLVVVGTLADIKADLVTSLPGLPYTPIFKIYSGYLTVNSTTNRSLHYVFIESQKNPIADPVVLWLNGGPGCSSMDGLFYENGPFFFPEGETYLVANNYSWNLNASMLYFESPAGVGFSPLDETLNLTDESTAIDNLAALVQFFAGYPEYSTQEFFISGESYAGIYVPTLAYQVLLWNNQTSSAKINLVGVLVGNGVTDWFLDTNTVLPFFSWWHGMIGQNIWDTWESNNCAWQPGYPEPALYDDICNSTYMQVIDAFDNVNVYDIYRSCVFDNQGTKHKYTTWSGLKEAVPCVDETGLYAYLNNVTVREALNVGDFNGTWDICADINYTINYTTGSIWVYPYLFDAGIRVQIYSGDTDASVPTIGSLAWIASLNLNETQQWRQWSLNSQVAGYTQYYAEGLKFVSIKGTGHMSIQWKRPEGAQMFWTFITNQEI